MTCTDSHMTYESAWLLVVNKRIIMRWFDVRRGGGRLWTRLSGNPTVLRVNSSEPFARGRHSCDVIPSASSRSNSPSRKMAEPDLYSILGVSKNASEGDIKKVRSQEWNKPVFREVLALDRSETAKCRLADFKSSHMCHLLRTCFRLNNESHQSLNSTVDDVMTLLVLVWAIRTTSKCWRIYIDATLFRLLSMKWLSMKWWWLYM